MPLTLHPFFEPFANECKISSEIWKTFVTLPLHADLRDEEIDYVIDALGEFERQS
jgi:perosamine synthetase